MTRSTRSTRVAPLPTPVSKKTKKAKCRAIDSIANALLSTMINVRVKRNRYCISYSSIMKLRKMNDRNTPWRNEWRSLIEKGFIQPASPSKSLVSGSKGSGNGIFTGNYELTEKGEDRAGSPEIKAMKCLIEAESKTSEEEHIRIRKICMNNRTVQIFDLLLKHGTLTRKELAATIGISDRGAPFSYGLRQLKELGYVVIDENSKRGSKALMLSDKAFVDPKDRPESNPPDPNILIANIEKVYGKEMKKADAAKSSSSIKKEEISEEVELRIKKEGERDLLLKKEGGRDLPVKKEDDTNE